MIVEEEDYCSSKEGGRLRCGGMMVVWYAGMLVSKQGSVRHSAP